MMILAHCLFAGVLTVVLLVGQSIGIAAQVPRHTLIMQSETFSRLYSAKYARLQGLSADVILVDLSESLEDVLVSGDHVSSISLDYKIQQLQRRLFGKLQENVCASTSNSAMMESLLKSVTVRALISLSGDAQWELTDAQFGMLAATLVRLIQSGTLQNFCASQGFNQFAR
jgi:hypothetical protein